MRSSFSLSFCKLLAALSMDRTSSFSAAMVGYKGVGLSHVTISDAALYGFPFLTLTENYEILG